MNTVKNHVKQAYKDAEEILNGINKESTIADVHDLASLLLSYASEETK